MRTKRELIEHFGSQVALARAMGVTQSAVSQWADDKPIPERHWWRLPDLHENTSEIETGASV